MPHYFHHTTSPHSLTSLTNSLNSRTLTLAHTTTSPHHTTHITTPHLITPHHTTPLYHTPHHNYNHNHNYSYSYNYSYNYNYNYNYSYNHNWGDWKLRLGFITVSFCYHLPLFKNQWRGNGSQYTSCHRSKKCCLISAQAVHGLKCASL